MSISTHVLDTSRGLPAPDVSILLDYLSPIDGWQNIASVVTNTDGRAAFPKDLPKHAGAHRLTFQTAPYFKNQSVDTFYPQIEIQFHITDPAAHYHIPLLLSPFGYTTYRGS